ncbi:MAG: DUF4276 family protein [Prolixibacteraceae bacterium]|jgi:hypothetical protein|nr:DUF4276 family protein [Prolixibacteraceae bacterium]
MSVVILNILCEGQTEDKFAQTVLKPYLKKYNIIVKTQLLCTSRSKGAFGGMLSFTQVLLDLSLWMRQNSTQSHFENHYYTTMFDLYKLPKNFPAMCDNITCHNCYEKIKTIEDGFYERINNPNFIPYIQLHEFEALVFAKLDELIIDYPDKIKQIEGLKRQLDIHGNNPELINCNPETAPSKRLNKALSNYNKTKTGPMVTQNAGIDYLKGRCPHFKEWIEKIEQLQVF